jgi:hypothetical protein
MVLSPLYPYARSPGICLAISCMCDKKGAKNDIAIPRKQPTNSIDNFSTLACSPSLTHSIFSSYRRPSSINAWVAFQLVRNATASASDKPIQLENERKYANPRQRGTIGSMQHAETHARTYLQLSPHPTFHCSSFSCCFPSGSTKVLRSFGKATRIPPETRDEHQQTPASHSFQTRSLLHL